MVYKIPRILLTPGEPAGIGPELVLDLALQDQACDLVAVADPDLMRQRAQQCGLDIKIQTWTPGAEINPHRHGHLTVWPVTLHQPSIAGELNPANAEYVLETLRQATDACRNGLFDALVTGPVHKGIINEAGISFTGHTEFLAQRCETGRVVMMLVAHDLRVALATTHLPLREVSTAITQDSLEETLQILDRDLRQHFAINKPRILVCGLNPHAGESGHLGKEEIEIIIPVLERLREQGLDIQGPLPADTLFVPQNLTEADAVLAMYHDQGLPVLKYMGFGQAVNVTLGLPIIRTSVDHGTALDLAGKGQADAGSLQAALGLAETLIQHRRHKRSLP